MNRHEYFKEVESSAIELIKEAIEEHGFDNAEEQIFDYMLHEAIDSHQFIIYSAHHLPILQFSGNADYMQDNLGGCEEVLKEKGISGLHQALAFWAFHEDVADVVRSKIDDYDPEAQE